MLNYRLGTVNDFHWGFKPVLSYSNINNKIFLDFVLKILLNKQIELPPW